MTKLSLTDKSEVLNAVAAALEDPTNDTCARRVVMRKTVWALATEMSKELAKEGIEQTPAEILSVAIEAGLSFAVPVIQQLHNGTMKQDETSAQNALAQLVGPEELTLQARADLYRAAFPDYPGLQAEKGWLLGVWNIGNNYKGSGYHGAYPPSYTKRITPLFPDQKRVLHLFSGSLEPGDYVRFDRRTDLPNGVDVVGEAEELTKHFAPDSFDIIYADPPYTESDAEKYGTCLCNRNKVVAECAKVLRPGGWLIWMDQVLPMYRKSEWKRCIEIAISRSTNHRIRGVFGFQRLPKVDEVESAAPPTTLTEQEEGYQEVFKSLVDRRADAMEF